MTRFRSTRIATDRVDGGVGFVWQLLFACIVLAATTGLANAQALTESLGSFNHKSSEPINIVSDVLEVREKEQTALFTGDVRAAQDQVKLRSKTLLVLFESKSKKKSFGSDSSVKRMEAKGAVSITTGPKQTTTSDWAIFDMAGQTITVGGNVVLSQGENVIKGDKLVIDLETGRSRFITAGSTTTSGRVRGLFKPQKAKPKTGAKRKPAKIGG